MSNANFAPYQPPPDERLTSQAAPSSSRVAAPSVPRSAPSKETNSRQSIDSDMDPRYATESYQSSVPQTPNSALPSATSYQPNFSSTPAWQQQQQQQPSNTSSNRQYPQNGRPDHLSYSTTHGWSLSSLCFAAWALPPFSSVLLLIIETENVSDAKRTAEEDLSPKTPFMYTPGPGTLSCISIRTNGSCKCSTFVDLEGMVWVVYFEHHRRHGFSRVLLGLRVSLDCSPLFCSKVNIALSDFGQIIVYSLSKARVLPIQRRL